MRAHLEHQCRKYPYRLKKDNQKTICFDIKKETDEYGKVVSQLKTHSFDFEKCKRALTEMIIRDELPFRFVEGDGFRKFCYIMEPRFIVPSRMAIARDCMKLFDEERLVLKENMRNQRICLTTDTWTSVQNINYMCLTAHWIDDDWKLHKRVLNFRQVSNHKGKTIGRELEMCLLDWGIDKILTLTVDNASSNNIAVEHLKGKTKMWKSTILSNEFLHVRCAAHILNLVVKDGLFEANASIVKIRNAVRFFRSSPARLIAFQKCVEKEKN